MPPTKIPTSTQVSKTLLALIALGVVMTLANAGLTAYNLMHYRSTACQQVKK